MTTTASDSRWEYDGDGVTTDFPYNNRIFAAADLDVYLGGVKQTLTTHYSVTNVGVKEGGNVVFVSPPIGGTKNVVIASDIAQKQETTFVDNDDFPAGVTELAFDLLTRLANDLRMRLDRALRFSDEVVSSASLLLPSLEASKILAVKVDATGFEFVDKPVDGVDGAPGADGADGADGQGVAVGGTAGQVLAKIDAVDFNTEWVDQSGGGGGLANIVEDTTPQLGGDLDYNAFAIVDPNGNEVLGFAHVGSAVNFVSLANAATAGDPGITADGTDTNVDLAVNTKGTGEIRLNANVTLGTNRLECKVGSQGQPSVIFGDSNSGLFGSGSSVVVTTDGSERLRISNGQTTTDNPIRVGDGTVSGPGYGFDADINTGMYRVGNDVLALTAGGVEGLRVTEFSSAITVDISGDLTLDGTVDGRDVATDGTKLDGIASGANNYSHPNHTGDVTSTGDGATVIANDAVTNAKAANMAEGTMKGRVAAGTGDPQDLTQAQARDVLGIEILTQAAYNGITPVAGRLYFING